VVCEQRYEKVGQSESESDWSRDEKNNQSADEGETDVEISQVSALRRQWQYGGWALPGLPCGSDGTVGGSGNRKAEERWCQHSWQGQAGGSSRCIYDA
jgi:hypothetical protein